jgi:steroid delta-isomerase-like uncharacterized protein
VTAREIVHTFYDEIWNRQDFAAIPRLCHEDLEFRGSLGEERRGLEGFESYVRSVATALGDYRCDIEDLVVEESKAFAKVHFSGVHRGHLLGHPATHKRVAWAGAALFTIERDRIKSAWVLGDLHGLVRQLSQDR